MSRFSNLEFNEESSEGKRFEKQPLKDGQSYFAEAEAAFHNGKFESALRLYCKVLEFDPSFAPAWTGQVRMLIELGHLQDADLWANKALEQFPAEAELLAAKAVALARQGDTHAALIFSDRSMEEPGQTAYVWLARSDVLLARKENRAEFCFERAIALAQGHWLVLWLAARIRAYYRQFALAIGCLQQALTMHSTHFLLWMELGRCQKAVGLSAGARQSFAQAMQLNPSCSETVGLLNKTKTGGLWSRFRHWLAGHGPS